MTSLAHFEESIQNVNLNSFDNEPDRQKALVAARALVRRLEAPMESLLYLIISSPATCTALSVAHDLDIFPKLLAEGGRPKTTAELAGKGEVKLVGRVLRHLSSTNFVAQHSADTWGPTPQTAGLDTPGSRATIRMSGEMGKWHHVQSDYLRKTGFKEPRDLQHCAITDYEGMTFFDVMKKNPDLSTTFGVFMSANGSRRLQWVNVFPSQELVASATGDGPVLVDMGGSTGHDAGAFVQKAPAAAGRVVVQDQPHVIEQSKNMVPAGVKAMGHDIFTPQPIKGAKAYFMKSVIHDWPDDEAESILKNVRGALKPGYSKLLIADMVVPLTGANAYQTGMDLHVSAGAGTKERTEGDWYELLTKTGYKIIKIHSSPILDESIIEAELA